MAVAAAANASKSYDATTITKAMESPSGHAAYALGYPLHFSSASHYTMGMGDPNPYKFFSIDKAPKDGSFVS